MPRPKGIPASKAQREAGRNNFAAGRAKRDAQRAEAKKKDLPSAHERWGMVLSGTLSVRDLDDDEVAKMRVRGKDGGFSGRPPMVPSHLAQQFREEYFRRTMDRFRSAAPGVSQSLVDIATDPDEKTSDRLKAMDMLLNRAFGRAPETIKVETTTPFEDLLRASNGKIDLDRDIPDDLSEMMD